MDKPTRRWPPRRRPPDAVSAPGTAPLVSRSVDWARVALLSSTGLLLVAGLVELYVAFTVNNWAAAIASDWHIYARASQRWLAGGGFYLPHQLAGPYQITLGDVLYPPTALYLFLPMSFLPDVVWYAIPILVTAWIVQGWRPRLLAWPLMAASLAYPQSLALIRSGNPDLWIVATIAAGLRFSWPGAFVLLKPSLLPFALAGIRSRGWWISAGILGFLTLPLLPLAVDWLRAVSDGYGWGGGGLLYSLLDLPFALLPVWAWLGRRKVVSLIRSTET